jgi:hypothetical protein
MSKAKMLARPLSVRIASDAILFACIWTGLIRGTEFHRYGNMICRAYRGAILSGDHRQTTTPTHPTKPRFCQTSLLAFPPPDRVEKRQ